MRRLILAGAVLAFTVFSLGLLDRKATREPFPAHSLDGAFSLAEQRTPVLLNFWASWCYPCEVEAPLLEELHRRSQGKLRVVGINSGEPPATVRRAVDSWNLTFPVVLDSDGSIRASYRILGQPHSLLLSREGDVMWEKRGPLIPEDLEGIQRLGERTLDG